jgi:integrase
MSYVDKAIRKPPATLTEAEQKKLLKVSGEHVRGYRDHVIFSLALGTGLRQFEIRALDVGSVYDDAGNVRKRVTLHEWKGRAKEEEDKGTEAEKPRGPDQEVFLPDSLILKLRVFRRWKKEREEDLSPDAALFVTSDKPFVRFSLRNLRKRFELWQKRAGFDRVFKFHALRHTAITNLYRATGDIRVAQVQARHASIETTTIYAHPADEDVARAVKGLPC